MFPCLVFLLLFMPAPLRAAPAGRRHLPGTGRFWHITDLHLDPSYHPSEDPTRVCLSSKGAAVDHAGLFGDFLCDSPHRLIQSAFAHMKNLTQAGDFIIWTGDSPPHVPPAELSTDLVIQVISNMTQSIRQHFPNLPVYPALGNHDYWPQDQMPTSTNAIYKAAAQLWAPWLQPDALRTLSQGGFYSQLVEPGLRVVSLNTILYYGPDKATENVTDPAGQFEWLEETLRRSAVGREKVYIIAHVPVGYLPFVANITAMREVHNERLVSIFRKYSDVIAGQFFGHTHRDSIMVLLDPEGRPVSSLFVSPAVTPIRHVLEPYSNNPALRMYKYDPEDYCVQDIWQFYLNLTEANQRRESAWRLEYIMTEAFGLSDLRPPSLLQLGLDFRSAQSQTFDRYFRHFMVSYDTDLACRGRCKLQQVCAILHVDLRGYSECVAGGL